MAGLAAIERFFERLFERPAARIFQPPIELAVLQRELERAAEEGRRRRDRRTWVPVEYTLRLSPTDLSAFAPAQAQVEAELAQDLRAYALTRGYRLAGKPVVALQELATLAPGKVEVVARPLGAPPPAGAAADEVQSGTPPVGEQTAVFRVAQPAAARAIVVVDVPGQPQQRLPVRPGTMRVGRAQDNDICLPDHRVSRHHGQLAVRHGTLIYRDLGSTNGSWANGRRVAEIALGPGDALELGGATLTIEPAG
jgi:hypothetical protein